MLMIVILNIVTSFIIMTEKHKVTTLYRAPPPFPLTGRMS